MTDVGRKRKQNQDSFFSDPEFGFFLVADGMGGHRGGEIASALAAETIAESFHRALSHEPLAVANHLTQSFATASRLIFQRALKEPELQGMGTTAVSVYFRERRAWIGHVGDSRCYLLLPNQIWQLTRDHSLVQEKLRAGLITRSQLKTDKMKNVITRSVGFEEAVDVDLYEMTPPPGAVFLLCSDGLSGLLDDASILEIVQKDFFENDRIEATVEHLVAAANERGGDDNVTAILVQPHPLS